MPKEQQDIIDFFDTGLRHIPHSLYIDLEPSVIDDVKTGPYQSLFHPKTMITGKEDAANNCCHYTVGKELMINPFIDKIYFEESVLGSMLLLEHHSTDYCKKSKLEFFLTTHTTLEHSDYSFMVDNEAIYDICRKNLGVILPSFSNLNCLIVQVILLITASLRFDRLLDIDLNEFQTNLVLFLHIHFPPRHLCTLLSAEKADHEQNSVVEMMFMCFKHGNQLVKCDPKEGKTLLCAVLQ
ncbi:tubulin alpha-3 chain [Mycena albidolilacea]|uniref:Tubulin alpha-3 chain n=1 Tax=Mycena albidolilacea TaxID=1033008 RepID=A0AAD7A6K5_9AGAR|nr:tubulin alpha-3 chain [Mycena albidolilacea]